MYVPLLWLCVHLVVDLESSPLLIKRSPLRLPVTMSSLSPCWLSRYGIIPRQLGRQGTTDISIVIEPLTDTTVSPTG